MTPPLPRRLLRAAALALSVAVLTACGGAEIPSNGTFTVKLDPAEAGASAPSSGTVTMALGSGTPGAAPSPSGASPTPSPFSSPSNTLSPSTPASPSPAPATPSAPPPAPAVPLPSPATPMTPPTGSPAVPPVASSPAPVGTGTRWSDPATWGGTVPPANSVVVIPTGKTVILDGTTPPLRGLQIQGTLVAGDHDVAITSDYVYVNGGRLQIGSATQPFLRNATITLTGSTPADNPGTPGFGNKVLAVMGGTLELHGRPSARSWTKLDGGDIAAGARQIRLAQAPGWRPGDQIVIATSSFNQNEYTTAEVESVTGNQVALKTPTRYRHFGTQRQVGDVMVDVRAEVGLLSRNIVVQGDSASNGTRIGGHAMFMAGSNGATIQIADVEFRTMGQFNQLGRYPMHFHVMGSSCRNCYVRNNTIRDSIQRGLVIHDTSGLTVSGNVVFNTVGHNVVIETETTNGNTLDGNLALVNRQPSPRFTEATLVTQNDRLPGNYWIRGAANAILNNAAAGSQSNGFIYDSPGPGNFLFRNNVVHAAMGQAGANEGDFDIMAGLMIIAGRPAGHQDQILDTLAYHNATGIWPEESDVPYVIERFVVAENQTGVQNRGVGSKQIYRNGVFIGQLPGSTLLARPGSAMHNQYGSDNRIESPTFANYPGGVGFDGTDTNPSQSSYWFSNARFIGGNTGLPLGGDMSRMFFADDTIRPRGYYVDATAPWLAPPGCAPVAGGDSGALRCAAEPGIAELEVRLAPGAKFGQKIDATLLRSDGLRYSRTSPGVSAGMHSTSVLADVPGLSYSLEQASSFYALRLWDTGGNATVINGQGRTLVNVPLAAPPRTVSRVPASQSQDNPGGDPGEGGDALPTPAPAHALRAMGSLAELAASPMAGYVYDPSSRRLWVNVSSRWVIVQP